MSKTHRVIRTPDQRLRVFVSSTLRELAGERQAAGEAIRRLRLAPVMFEMGARPHPASDLYRAYLDQSHVFLGIYWQSYGWVAPEMDVSGLEDEYHRSGEKPKLIYIKRPAPELESGLKRLLNQIKADDQVSYKYFTSTDELRDQIERDLALLLTERFELSQTGIDSPSIDRKAIPFGLPAQLSSFIGREKEVTKVLGILNEKNMRLITLTGPGGTGKTRLALQVATEQAEHMTDGVVFVALAETTTSELVISKIAQALGLREGGSQSLLESLVDYLKDKKILLLLDNFEQVLEAASVVTHLLRTSENLKVMVTSRTLLKLSGEVEFAVPPLQLPELPDQDPEEMKQVEAVEMFIERARAANPMFTIDGENIGQIATICRRLDGLPLAIELAAARTKMLTPEMILDLLSDRLGLLVGGPRDLPERQQTLRNTLEWSIHLLSDDLKILFARLGVFVGGFTLEAATVICARGLRGDVDVFEGISGLLDNSLIRMENVASIGPRFRMLETIRDYALKLLDEGDERRALKEQHAQFYAEKSSLAGSMYLTEEADFWLDWMGVEHDNMRATLSWFLAEPAGQDFSPWLLASMLWFWYRRGFFIEGREWCERLLNSPVADASEEARGLALFGSGAMAMWQGDLIHALIFIDRAVEILRRAEDPYMMATVLLFSGTARVNHGDDEEGMVPLAEALEIFKELEMQWYQAITLIHMGNASLGMNNSLRAQQYLEQAHELGRRIGERWLLSLVLNNYGEVARVKGDYSQASEYYEESESLLREMGDKGDLARLVHNLGSVNLRLGNLERARSLLSESIEMFRKLNNQRGLSECLATMAGLWIERSNLRRAASLLSAADMMLKTTGGAWWPADRVEVERNLQAIHDHLNEVDYSQSWQLGQEMTLDEAISLAFNVDAESNGH